MDAKDAKIFELTRKVRTLEGIMQRLERRLGDVEAGPQRKQQIAEWMRRVGIKT